MKYYHKKSFMSIIIAESIHSYIIYYLLFCFYRRRRRLRANRLLSIQNAPARKAGGCERFYAVITLFLR